MIKIKNCSFTNCGSVFGLGGDVNLTIDGLYIDNCGTVYDIDSEDSNINAHARNVNVTNTETYIKVGGAPAKQSIASQQTSSQVSRSFSVFPNENYAMRIALQYINATSKI
ncbi:hypothetical protein ACLIN6_003625 [Vibrio cholerae]|uniref:hypothetical protein n=1 Tax=Vibrio TaxID=662 RepID=UPI0009CC3AF9|nr:MULTISPECIES: hypothetical protein [Vibrio]OQK34490.1 hypothetical protein XM74_u0075 [Vibrio vulnificus]POC21341.1 hypothetical protein CRN46_14910 [Vibrio vulnificus]RBM24532.1 hypothetical protein DLR59_19050 [Vibrio tarriae]GHY56678.1 hypothetical protein VCSRO119_3763 [Vibrio cholerae]GIA64808.1 hypothetical protein VCSRO87_3764 [Vibrio cholerae]